MWVECESKRRMAKFSGAKSVAFVLPSNDCEAKQEQNADNKQNNTLN